MRCWWNLVLLFGALSVGCGDDTSRGELDSGAVDADAGVVDGGTDGGMDCRPPGAECASAPILCCSRECNFRLEMGVTVSSCE
ncbi:MAG: hypothetical protein AAGF12_09540 [Myxococcota bacterium]